MTRDQAERLIERLADKNSLHYRASEWVQHTDGSVSHTKFDITKPCYNPVMLTDVLEKLLMVDYDRLRLVMLWEDCGVTKSLQDIMLEGQFDAPRGKTVPSAPHELFEYLIQLFPEI